MSFINKSLSVIFNTIRVRSIGPYAHKENRISIMSSKIHSFLQVKRLFTA